MDSDPSPGRYACDYSLWAVCRDYTDEASGLRLIVVRGPFSFNAYLGVPKTHTLAGMADLEFPCHGGIAFREWTNGAVLPDEHFFWGWDYAHAGDYFEPACETAGKNLALLANSLRAAFVHPRPLRRWTLGEVHEEGLDALINVRERLHASDRYVEALARTAAEVRSE